MKLGDIYSAMVFGEMENLFHRSADTPKGKIDTEELPKFTHALQRGLTALHARFDLRRESVKILIQPDQLIYPLTVANATSSSLLGTKYIDDSNFKFTDRSYLVAVEVIDHNGCKRALNENGNEDSFRELQPGVIQIPENYDGASFTLWFRADHPPLNVNLANAAPEVVNVDIRPVYLEALINFVASKLKAPVGFGVEGTNESNNYEVRFERECAKLERRGNQITETLEDNRFAKDGWA